MSILEEDDDDEEEGVGLTDGNQCGTGALLDISGTAASENEIPK